MKPTVVKFLDRVKAGEYCRYTVRAILATMVLLAAFIPQILTAQISYYSPKNLITPQFRNKGDLFLSMMVSTQGTDFSLGYAMTNGLAAYVSKCRMQVSSYDDIILKDKVVYTANRESNSYSFGFGRYFNQVISPSLRFGLFAEYMQSSDRTDAKYMYRSTPMSSEATLFAKYRVTSVRANVLLRDNNLETKSRIGYNARFGKMEFFDINSRSNEVYRNEYDRIKSVERVWVLEHGFNLVIVGKRLSIFGQLNFNHSFYAPHLDGPMPRFMVSTGIGISMMPNIFNVYEPTVGNSHEIKEVLPENPIEPTKN